MDGDDLRHNVESLLRPETGSKYPHLDSVNAEVKLVKDSDNFLDDPKKPIVSANAYLGCRAIRKGLDEGADIILCGRVSDASPVIGAAAWWHGWSDSAYDELAGALIAGHLIECSTYSTGANFAGFYKYQTKDLLNLGLPIAEIDATGACVITKHESLNGYVTPDIIKCQFLYELQGETYLNSDVTAHLTDVKIEEESKNRVRVTGITGSAPPPTTKLAVFYRGGFQCEVTMNATGYATSKKFDLMEAQLTSKLEEWGVLKNFDVLDFQRAGIPEPNPRCQMASTTYLRIFAQAQEQATLGKLMGAFAYNGMAHYAGAHNSMDMRTAAPIPFLAYFPALVAQTEIEEAVSILSDDSASDVKRIVVGPPAKTEALKPRSNYETAKPAELSSFGPTTMAPLGDIALARSGDKGANINLGVFVHTDEEWEWLRSFLTRTKVQELMGSDWQDWFFIERVEMPKIKAVHFVIYGPLGRGVSSSRLLDALGKGFGEFIRAVHVPIPTRFLTE